MNDHYDTADAERYRRLAEQFTKVVEAVPAQRWESPSPCAGWVARDVVEHVVSTERDLLARMPFGEHEAAALDTMDAIAAWPTVRDAVQAALDDPGRGSHVYDGFFGPTTFAETIGKFYCVDLILHRWDLARAAGLGEYEQLDAADIAWAREAMAPMGEHIRMEGIFGPEVAVSETATAQERFLAWAGRQP